MMMTNNFWDGRKVFITGVTGLLGSALCRRLLARGAEVTGLIRDWVPDSNFYQDDPNDRINIVHGNIEDYELLERSLNEYEIDTVFHLCAQTIVGTANRNPLSTFAANIAGTWNILEAARRNERLVKRVVVASSDKAYGEAKTLPYDETTPLRGQHPYDVSKSCADLIAQSYYHTFGQPVAVVRCGNLFGAGDLNFNRIIPGTIRSLLRDEAPLIRSNGKYIRDYIYVEDAVSGYMLVAAQLEDSGNHGEAFNFSFEEPVTVLELTDQITALMGKTDIKPKILNEASAEIIAQHLSASKARQKLGWQPEHSLEEGLKLTIAWYEEFFRTRR